MTVRRDNRKGWIVDVVFTFPDGRKERVKRKSPVQTRRGAEQYERQIREELLNNPEPKEEEPTPPTLAEFAREFIQTYASSNNKKSEVDSKKAILRRYLLPLLGDLHLDQIGVRQIEQLKANILGQGLSPKTTNNALAVLSKMLRYAAEIEIIGTAPRFKMLRLPQARFDFLSFEEARQLLAAAASRPDWQTMILCALRTGLRYSELSELRWPDVDLGRCRLLVSRRFYKGEVNVPKGGRSREVPLSPELVEALASHPRRRGSLVFCKPDGGRRIHRRADVMIKKLAREAGLRRISWHVLRHTFASHLVMRGAPMKVVQELLGHTDLVTTMRYAHLAPEIKQDAVTLLDESDSADSRPLYGPKKIEQESGEAGKVELKKKAEQLDARLSLEKRRGGRDSNPRPPA